MSHRAALTTCLVLLLSSAFTSCGNSVESPSAPTPLGALSIEKISTSASSNNVEGMRLGGRAPAPAGGPRITVSGNQTVINGGTLLAAINSDAPFSTIYVLAGGRTAGVTIEGSGGIDGYYQIATGSTQTSANVLLAFPQEIPLDQFDLLFAVASPAGIVGPFERLSVTVTEVGIGDVQVTLSWDVNSDVDLHVVEPSGEEIFYAQRLSASGGELDLDSNAACEVDGVRNENIRWPVGRAPRGQYIVRVDYWSSCGFTRTNYTVRVFNGGSAQVFTGFFTGPGDEGGLGSGRTITTFERLTGPSVLNFVRNALTPAAPAAIAPKRRLAQ